MRQPSAGIEKILRSRGRNSTSPRPTCLECCLGRDSASTCPRFDRSVWHEAPSSVAQAPAQRRKCSCPLRNGSLFVRQPFMRWDPGPSSNERQQVGHEIGLPCRNNARTGAHIHTHVHLRARAHTYAYLKLISVEGRRTRIQPRVRSFVSLASDFCFCFWIFW